MMLTWKKHLNQMCTSNRFGSGQTTHDPQICVFPPLAPIFLFYAPGIVCVWGHLKSFLHHDFFSHSKTSAKFVLAHRGMNKTVLPNCTSPQLRDISERKKKGKGLRNIFHPTTTPPAVFCFQGCFKLKVKLEGGNRVKIPKMHVNLSHAFWT